MKTFFYAVKNGRVAVWQLKKSNLVELGVSPLSYMDSKQGAYDIICSNAKGMRKFPRNVVLPPSATVNETRDYIHFSNGFTQNYPAYLGYNNKIQLKQINSI